MSPDQQSAAASDKAEWFTATHWSVVLMAGQTSSSQAADALEKLCRTYWYPVDGEFVIEPFEERFS